MIMKRLEQICKKLNDKLTKEYGEYGNIICTIEGDHVKVIFEENDYLYYALNFDMESNDKVSNYIDNILEKYDTYYELENSCIMTIF